MPHILVLITLSDSGIATIRSTPGLVQQEMEFLLQSAICLESAMNSVE
jgi:hypothetical protein